MSKCRAVGCCNLQGDVDIHFFRFPLDEKRCTQWKQFVECVVDVPPEKCYKNMRLCHLHFDEKYFKSTKKNRLNKDAIPTIRSVDIPTSGNAHTSGDVKPLRQGELEEESEICMIEESFDKETDMDPLAMKLELDEEAPSLEKAYKDEDEAMSNTDYSHSFDGVKECRMKWRNLRDHYMRGHLKNGNRHMQWTFYEPLSFLEKIRNHTQINGSSGTTEPDQNDDEDDVFSETEEKSTDRPNISHDAQDDRLVVTTVVVEDQDETNEDIDKFMQNIAARLKRLPQHSIDLAKMNILAQVTELELEQSWTISASEPYS
ncbi:uncharacterized protein isoform X1 [Leptinotarsa decemlineata]|uniref:uncharacterized protein isoform X1 n=1 Tax=Leptinotarsa decemlineata TaxID=7539 RepID=UPI003D30B3A1